MLELMVAVSVFSVLGMVSWQILSTVAGSSKQLEAAGDQLFAAQKSMFIITRDLTQISTRPVRDQNGELEFAVTTWTADQLISFTRRSGITMPGRTSVALSRISYQLEPMEGSDDFGLHSLYREVWPALDRDIGTEPVRQLLFDQLRQVDLEFFDQEAEVHFDWPTRFSGTNTAEQNQNIDIDTDSQPPSESELPKGILIRIHSKPLGTIERIVSL